MSELFCERLRRLRKARGISQRKLAAKVQVTNVAVSEWERAVYEPSAHNMRDLARALGVSADYLMTGREAPHYAALIAAVRQSGTRDPRLLALVEGR